jgi:multidrug efflux system membrane fusion protein
MNQTQPSGTSMGIETADGVRRRRWWPLFALLLLILLVAAGWRLTRGSDSGSPAAGSKTGRGPDAARAVPVAAQPVTVTPSFDITLGALGTVIARNTVVVHVRVDGQLVKVNFREGQLVRAGDLLAQIDPRPFQVVLDNAQGTLERDKAQLANAMVDLERYRGLIADDSIPKQQYDSQLALVQQDKALVAADQAQVDSARLQLSFTQVTAPVGGRVGLRQIDQGNMVHASDTNGLVVITEVQPIDVVFPIPQDRLPSVRRRLAEGARLKVDAYESDNRTLLGAGTLLTTDNQIDTTTGTIKLKAEFANRDTALFPNQFVNVRLHLDQVQNALTIPSSAVQRGAPGLYAYVIKDDSTVQIRPLKLGSTEGERVQVLDGLAADERVVTDGVDKLREGAAVVPIDPAARNGTGDGVRKPGGADRKGAGNRNGTP